MDCAVVRLPWLICKRAEKNGVGGVAFAENYVGLPF
jgi:hypothetical protein